MSKGFRSWQGSNLRGQSPSDFKSDSLTTRTHCLSSRGQRGGGAAAMNARMRTVAKKLQGGFEPPSLDSKSRVLTVTPLELAEKLRLALSDP